MYHSIISLDRSGSMRPFVKDTLGGFNKFVESQERESNITLITFNNVVKTIYSDKLCKDCDKLNESDYEVGGSTALYDAIGESVRIGEMQGDNIKIIVVIITDGYENASKKYSSENIKKLITDKQELGWEFIFMGAEQDAILSARALNIPERSAMSYNLDESQVAFNNVSSAIKRSASTPGHCTPIEFTQLERKSSMGHDDVPNEPPRLRRQLPNHLT